MITPEQLTEIRHKVEGDTLLQKLLSEYESIMASEVLETYITLRGQLRDWNSQLKIEGKNGRINLFADKDTKEFDRVFKYFTEIETLTSALEKLRSRLTPQEQKDVEKIRKVEKVSGVAM